MKRSVFASFLLAASAAFVVPGSAHGQKSTTRGFNVGVHLTGAGLKVENTASSGTPNPATDRDDGAGGGIHLGYGINRNITLLLQLDGAGFMLHDGPIHGQWGMAHGDLGARFNFASTLRRWVPYLQATVTARGVTVKDPIVNGQQSSDISFSGGGFSGGGGLLVYLKETFALEAQLMGTTGKFEEVKVDNVTVSGLDIDATSSRFSLGLSWWP